MKNTLKTLFELAVLLTACTDPFNEIQKDDIAFKKGEGNYRKGDE
ncbi:MAG: hypothetical protein R8G66_32780 [Cytophagales bacterium]|nr:hypothetical protein [Cytophagales bacterium]